MIRVPRKQTEELKGMISDGLHIFGRAMSLAEQICEDAQMGERNMDYPYGDRYGDRMGMRDYMGERRGRSSVTGRYMSM